MFNQLPHAIILNGLFCNNDNFPTYVLQVEPQITMP